MNKTQHIFASFVAIATLVFVPQLTLAFGGFDLGGGSYGGYSTGSGSSYGGYSSGSGSSYGGYSSGSGSSYGGYSSGSGSSYGGYSSGSGSSYGGYSYGDSSYGLGSYGGYSYGDSSYGGYSSGSGSSYGSYSTGGGSTYSGYSSGSGSSYGGYSSGSGSTYGGYSTGSGASYAGYSTGSGSTYGGYSTGSGSTYGGYSTGSGASYGGYTPTTGTGNSGPSYTNAGNQGGASYRSIAGNGNNGTYGNGGYNNGGNNGGCNGCGNYDDEDECFEDEECFDDCYYGDDCYDDCEIYDDCYEEEIPLEVVCTPAHTTAEIGDSVTFTAHASGGYGSYSYEWSGAVSGSGRTITRTFNSDGEQYARVTVRSGYRTASALCEIDIEEDEDLDVVCIASPDEVEEGEEVVWRANASGGNGSYTYHWSGDVSGNNRTERETYNSDGRKTGTVRVTSGGKSVTKTCSVKVEEDDDNDDFRAVCDVTPDNPEKGETVRWSVRASGGDGDYEYRWSGDVTGDNRTETKRYNTAGRKTATVRVESDGKTIRKTCDVYIDEDRVVRDTNPSSITLVQSTPTIPPGTLSSGVFLSDLPYTGLKENIKTIIFFFGLMLWSGVVAYIFYKRKAEKSAGKKLSHSEMIQKFKTENMARKNLAI